MSMHTHNSRTKLAMATITRLTTSSNVLHACITAITVITTAFAIDAKPFMFDRTKTLQRRAIGVGDNA